jgi:hypothetical protein
MRPYEQLLGQGLTHKSYMYDPTTKLLYLAQVDGLAKYFGFNDNEETYTIEYYTNHFDLSIPNCY